jgi:glutamate-5-semialdehyde dehydrogenase
MIISTALKNKTLRDLAALLVANKEQLLENNRRDLEQAASLDPTLVDRLKVDEKKVKGMIAAIEEVIDLEDPQGTLLSRYDHPNGMTVENKVVPFGRILIIYESRPDVTIEAAISAFKAGNRIYLKGGKEARNSNLFLVSLWKQALESNQLAADLVSYLDIGREETQKLLKENPYKFDLIIPRGGDGLINYIRENTAIPLIISGRGNNFVYVHQNADLQMAKEILLNGKSRLSVCNATDKVLFHKHIPRLKEKMQEIIDAANAMGLEVIVDGKFFESFKGVSPIIDRSIYGEEFLSPKILFALIEDEAAAIDLINTYSGGHSATIVSSDKTTALQFQQEVDCAAVYHNASTRFTDGGQFGFGAEIAISTQKLHFRGPVGLAQLVTNKWFISANGQVRN